MKASVVNVLNMPEILSSIRKGCETSGVSEALTEWGVKTVRKALSSKDYAVAARHLQISSLPCVTPREYRLLEKQSGLGLYSFISSKPVTEYYRLTAEDYSENPWLQRAIDSGEDLVYWDLSSMNFGILHHLMEAVLNGLGVREDYSAVTLEAAQEYARLWQEALERKANTNPGREERVYREEDLEVWLLIDQQAYVREGHLMRHCLGSYTVRENRLILSVRRGEQILASGEVDLRQQWDGKKKYAQVKQIRGPANSVPPKDAEDCLMRYIRSEYSTESSGIIATGSANVSSAVPVTGLQLNNGVSVRGDSGITEYLISTPKPGTVVENMLDTELDVLISRLRQRGANL